MPHSSNTDLPSLGPLSGPIMEGISVCLDISVRSAGILVFGFIFFAGVVPEDVMNVIWRLSTGFVEGEFETRRQFLWVVTALYLFVWLVCGLIAYRKVGAK